MTSPAASKISTPSFSAERSARRQAASRERRLALPSAAARPGREISQDDLRGICQEGVDGVLDVGHRDDVIAVIECADQRLRPLGLGLDQGQPRPRGCDRLRIRQEHVDADEGGR